MSIAFDLITDRLLAALRAAPALAGGNVDEPLSYAVPAEITQWIEVRLEHADGASPYLAASGRQQWQTAVAIDCYVRASAGGTPRATLNATLADVSTRVLACDFSGCGVVSFAQSPRIEWARAQGDTPLALASYVFVINHDTTGPGLVP